MDTKLLLPDSDGLALACRLLQQGQAVALPTETVYGLAADATNPEAVAKIFAAKGRPADNPLIVHVSDMAMAEAVAVWNDQARKLAAAFWPGPLTVVLPKKEIIPAATSAGLATVGVRMPSHPVIAKVIADCGLPLAAPSANLSGKPSPTDAAEVLQDMQGRIPLVVDGGPCAVGLESTVVSLAGEKPLLLRPGYVTKAQLEQTLGTPVEVAGAVFQEMAQSESPASPGMKYKHYAPSAEVTIFMGTSAQYCEWFQKPPAAGVWALCYEEDLACLPKDTPVSIYGRKSDSASQAAGLFRALRLLDEKGARKALAHFAQSDGVSDAVLNRLLRAAAFRVLKP